MSVTCGNRKRPIDRGRTRFARTRRLAEHLKSLGEDIDFRESREYLIRVAGIYGVDPVPLLDDHITLYQW